MIRRAFEPLEPRIRSAGTKSPRWARIYYAFFHGGFGREQQAVLAGRRSYRRSLASPDGTSTILRRNVHRLEKGLLMRPRRVPFALDYIEETVDAYARCCAESTAIDPTELQWGHDVLSEYFAANDGQPEIQELKDTFFRAGSTCAVAERNGERMIPYRRNLTAPPPVTIEALADLAQRRRSVRWFLQKPVDRAVIDRALEVAAQAPSACNRQPFEFRIFDEPELVQKVVNIPFGLAGYGHNVPVAVVVVGKQRHYFDERDRHLIYIDASLAVMGFLYALEASGLASCCVNWPDIEGKEERMAELLALEPDERPVMLVVLGHPDPDGKVARSTKKNLSQLRRYNFE